MIVALTHYCPFPPTLGGSVRIVNFLSHLSRYDVIDLLYPRNYFAGTKLACEKETFSSGFIGTAFRTGPIVSTINTSNRLSGISGILKMYPFAYPSLLKSTFEENQKNTRLLIFECLYIYSAVRRGRAKWNCGKIIYDAHNVEYDYQSQNSKYFEMPVVDGILKQSIFQLEHELCEISQAILVVSPEDKMRMSQLYDIPLDKIHLLPNGVDTRKIKPVTNDIRLAARKRLNLGDRPVVAFMGSSLKANIDALEFIENLAPKMEEYVFLVIGKVGEHLRNKRSNVVILGEVSEEMKSEALAASNIAINPVNIGSGTNVKMLEYLAMGLPTVSTRVGSRGLGIKNEAIVVAREEFEEAIRYVTNSIAVSDEMSKKGRLLAETYDWRRLTDNIWSEVLSKISSC